MLRCEAFNELYSWLLADSIQRIEAKTDSAAEAKTLEEYAQELQSRRPPEEQIQLAIRFVAAQKAGEFYVRYITALQKAMVETLGAVSPNLPKLPELTPAQRAQAVQQYRGVALVSFLQRFEALTEPEVLRVIKAYETSSGQWYVDAYTAAIEEAITNAARRTAEAMRRARSERS